MRIEGSSVLVTGAGSGLGLGTARRFLAAGAHVVLVDLPESPAKEIAAEMGSSASFAAADITDPIAVGEALDLAARNAPVRAVVHCAGRGGDKQRILDRDRNPADPNTFAEVLRVNLVGTYNVLCQSAARMSHNEIVDGDRGSIVLTASVAAFEGQIGQTAYTASKAGVHGITLVAARDLAKWNIRVNTIAPGTFDTAMLGRLSDEVRNSLSSSIPHPPRLGDPDDYARMALSLVDNGYVNGETIRLDGALRMGPR